MFSRDRHWRRCTYNIYWYWAYILFSLCVCVCILSSVIYHFPSKAANCKHWKLWLLCYCSPYETDFRNIDEQKWKICDPFKIIQIEAIFLHFHSSFISTLFVVVSGVVAEDKEEKKRSEFVSLMHWHTCIRLAFFFLHLPFTNGNGSQSAKKHFVGFDVKLESRVRACRL